MTFCKCGNPKPYRRAFQCAACWAVNKLRGAVLFIGRSEGKGTLRAGNIADVQ